MSRKIWQAASLWVTSCWAVTYVRGNRMQVTLHEYSQQHDNISFGAQEKTGTWCHIGRVDKASWLGALERGS